MVPATRPTERKFPDCDPIADIAELGDLRIDTWWANPATSERPIPAGKEQTLRATGGHAEFMRLPSQIHRDEPSWRSEKRLPTRRSGGCVAHASPSVH
jgi:hypothetical protein